MIDKKNKTHHGSFSRAELSRCLRSVNLYHDELQCFSFVKWICDIFQNSIHHGKPWNAPLGVKHWERWDKEVVLNCLSEARKQLIFNFCRCPALFLKVFLLMTSVRVCWCEAVITTIYPRAFFLILFRYQLAQIDNCFSHYVGHTLNRQTHW